MGFASRLFPVMLLLASGFLGARLPLTDRGYQELAHGRRIAAAGKPATSPVRVTLETEETPPGWAGSWILFQIERAGGEAGLRGLAVVLTAGGAILLYLPSRSGSGLVTAAAATGLARSGLDISAALFSWPLFAACALSLRALHGRAWWALLLVPLLLGLWANLNREAALGFALLALTLLVDLGRAVGRLRGQNESRQGRHLLEPLVLLGVSGAAVAAVAFTPGSLDKMANPLAEAVLVKRAGLAGWAPLRVEENPYFFILAGVSGALTGLLPLSVVLAEALSMAGFLILSLVSGHFAVFFAAAAAFPAARSLAALALRLESSRGRALGAGWTGWLALSAAAMATLPHGFAPVSRHPFASAVEVIRREKLSGPLFHVPEAGGLAAWKLESGFIPFADLSPRSLAAFNSLVDSRELGEIFEEHQAAVALISPDFALRQRDAREALRNRALALIYFDDGALLYARPESNPERVGAMALRHFDPLTPPEDYPIEELPPATAELFRYLDENPPSARGLFTLGGLLLRAARREEALEAFEASRRLGPDNLAVQRTLSRLYLEKGMYRLAEEASAKALRLGKEEEMVYNLGAALYGQGRFAEAARQFEEAVALDQENFKARRALVDLYRRLGKADESLLESKKLADREAAAIGSFLLEAEGRRLRLDFAGAAEIYLQALEIRPGDAQILWELALVLLTDNRLEEAAAALRDLLRSAPRQAAAHLTLGVLCARRLGCPPEEARLHLEKFLELAPDDPNAELARAELAALAPKSRGR